MDGETKNVLTYLEYIVGIIALTMIGVILGMIPYARSMEQTLVLVSLLNFLGIILADVLLFKIYKDKVR